MKILSDYKFEIFDNPLPLKYSDDDPITDLIYRFRFFNSAT